MIASYSVIAHTVCSGNIRNILYNPLNFELKRSKKYAI